MFAKREKVCYNTNRDREELFDEPAYQVVRSKQFEFGPMSVQEAILQMNLIGHSFFAFRNEEKDGAFSVVYRRNEGGYGILVDKT